MRCHRGGTRADCGVTDPRVYRWSRHHALAFGEPDPLLIPHPESLGLSGDPATRPQAYPRMVMDAVDPADVEAIRHHLQRQHAYGSDRFRKIIEVQLGRNVGTQTIGQPRKQKESGDRNPVAGSESLSLDGI